LLGYGFGGDAQYNGADRLHRAIHHVNLGHGAAVDVVRERVPGSLIGCIHNYQACLPSTPADTQGAEYCDTYWNRAFPDPQCLGSYPLLMRAAMEPHMQAGDLARIHRPLDWFSTVLYCPGCRCAAKR
jgi:beta-glucosidase